MTWEELKEKAKEMKFYKRISKHHFILNDLFWFDDDGCVCINSYDGTWRLVSRQRTPEQMLMIMRGLE